LETKPHAIQWHLNEEMIYCIKIWLKSFHENMISVCNSRFGSQELAKGRDSGGRRAAGWAATKRWVRMTLMYVYRSYEPCRVLVCELFYIASPIIFDLESIYYCRFGSQELAKGTDSATRAAGSEKVSQWGFDMCVSNDLSRV